MVDWQQIKNTKPSTSRWDGKGVRRCDPGQNERLANSGMDQPVKLLISTQELQAIGRPLD
jgi:hypothetical protein